MTRESRQIIVRHRAPMPRPRLRVRKTRLRDRVIEHAMVACGTPADGRLETVAAALHEPKTAGLALAQALGPKGVCGSTMRLPRG
jgi:hypothetical protein